MKLIISRIILGIVKVRDYIAKSCWDADTLEDVLIDLLLVFIFAQISLIISVPLAAWKGDIAFTGFYAGWLVITSTTRLIQWKGRAIYNWADGIVASHGIDRDLGRPLQVTSNTTVSDFVGTMRRYIQNIGMASRRQSERAAQIADREAEIRTRELELQQIANAGANEMQFERITPYPVMQDRLTRANNKLAEQEAKLAKQEKEMYNLKDENFCLKGQIETLQEGIRKLTQNPIRQIEL